MPGEHSCSLIPLEWTALQSHSKLQITKDTETIVPAPAEVLLQQRVASVSAEGIVECARFLIANEVAATLSGTEWKEDRVKDLGHTKEIGTRPILLLGRMLRQPVL